MFLANAVLRSILLLPLNARHFESLLVGGGGDCLSLISALTWTMATALQRLRQSHRENQEVDLLYVSILWLSFKVF